MSNKNINLPNFGFSKKPISIITNNIDGMSQNFDQLLIQLSALQNKFNFIAITETNINESHKNLYKFQAMLLILILNTSISVKVVELEYMLMNSLLLIQ